MNTNTHASTTPNYTTRRLFVGLLAMILVPLALWLGLEVLELLTRGYCQFTLWEGRLFNGH